MSYIDLIKVEDRNKIFRIEKIDVSEELPQIGTMYVKELPGYQKMAVFQAGGDQTDQMYMLICLSLCDENGVCTETPESFKELLEIIPDKTLIKIFNACTKVNSLDKDGEAEIKKE